MELTDFAATAELIQTLDLVISVDTAVASGRGLGETSVDPAQPRA